jgi:uncharacterized protein (DUF608 family)
MHTTTSWPVATSYDARHLRRIALPLGGIGTGTVSLGGRGDLRDWEIFNTPNKGFTPAGAFFALHVNGITRALEGYIDPEDFEGASGCPVPNHGVPRFAECRFDAAYPLGQVHLSDPEVPLAVTLQAFTPLIPGDADASGYPAAVLRYVLHNPTDAPLTAAVCGSVPNLVEAGGTLRNLPRADRGVQGVFLTVDDGNPAAVKFGSQALLVLADAATTRTAWRERGWSSGLLDFWDDFSADGRLDPVTFDEKPTPHASLATEVVVPAGGTAAVTFILAWHFPNRQGWFPPKECDCGEGCTTTPDFIGNYYATQFADAWEAAVALARTLPALETKTVAFVRAVCDSGLPAPVVDAALSNLSTLRSQTCFRTPDGYLFAWEGCNDKAGCCFGSCTHVWNYEQATPFLFGEIARGMREVEFLHATRDDGLMTFRVSLPLSKALEWTHAAADGQMGCIMKAYREWQLHGNDDWLRRLWPRVKAALAFCWIPDGWDGDVDGVMEGCQHNTMDVEYFGPNIQMTGWYLGALRAAEAMARYLGDTDFAARCHGLYAQGRAWVDAHLFNGEYYEQEVRPPTAPPPPELSAGMGAKEMADPAFQLGSACLVDGLVGQYMAHVVGLGYLHDADHVRASLDSVRRYNFRPLAGHFNNMRTYALQDEAGVLMGTYPRGNRPALPFPYANEVMTGFEYTAAVGMLYEGLVDEGLGIIAAIRARYDGRRRNPFNEAECGHHYGRAMASWAAVLALTGFHYSAVTGVFTMAARDGVSVWSTGDAWGTVTQAATPLGRQVLLKVLHGALTLRRVTIAGAGTATLIEPRTLREGDVWHEALAER